MSKEKSAPIQTRKHLARAARERRMRQIVLWSTVVVTILVVGVIAYGLVDLWVLQPRQPVARVNGVALSLSDFEKNVRYQRFQLIRTQYYPLLQAAQFFASDAQSQQYYTTQLQQLQSYLADSQTFGQQVLDRMIENELIRQEAKRRGLTVSAAEVDARLKEFFGFYPNGTPTPTVTPTSLPTDVPPTVNPTVVAAWTPTATVTPTATLEPTASATPGATPTATPSSTPRPTATPFTEQAFNTAVISYTGDLKKETGLSSADLKRIIEGEMYREKLQTAMEADTPTSQEQVRARHVLVDSEDLANAIYAEATAGKDFAELAAQYSKDTGTAAKGGYLGWFAQGDMVAEFEVAAFALQAGAIGKPIKTSYGWHIIQVLERGQRPLDATQLSAARTKAFDAWLAQQRAAVGANSKPVVETLPVWQDNVPTTPALPTGN